MSWNRNCTKTLTVSLGLMLLLTLFVFSAGVLLLFGAFAPGVIFGLLLVSMYPANVDWKNILFVVLSSAIYFLCFWITTAVHADSNLHIAQFTLEASCLGSLLLGYAYQLLILNRWSFKLLLVILLFVGLMSALPSTAFIYFEGDNLSGYHEDNRELYHLLFLGGLFLIYPFWQTTFVLVISMRKFQPGNDLSKIEVLK